MKSDAIKKGIERAGNRSLLFATGMTRKAVSRPLIGIASSFTDLVPGHCAMRDLERFIEKGIHSGGGYAAIFGVPAICDGTAMGHSGMNYSLPSRELIADCVETMARANCFDGMVLLTDCDKITPGMLMAAFRVNIPCIVVTAGPMLAGMYKMKRRDLVRDGFELVGVVKAGKMSVKELSCIEMEACPGPGSCAGRHGPGQEEDAEDREPDAARRPARRAVRSRRRGPPRHPPHPLGVLSFRSGGSLRGAALFLSRTLSRAATRASRP